MQPAPNLVVAERFRLNRQLGRGGMGSVWHATHLGLDTACAVKFIEGEYAQNPEAQSRFEREAKAAAQLRSAHVVQILDHGVWQGTPYIAMELLDGEELGKRLVRVGRMSPREILVIVTQVSRALTKAHGAGIVHRDLKPDNIFIVREDDREIAKVLDFGIAKASNNAIEGSATKTGAMLGTPYYMSPEQAQGTKSVDSRSDLWSLAVIVFQALTGRLPFESEALGDLLMKIMVSPIPVPSQVVPDVPPAFDRWWAKASSRDPAGRFQTPKEFADSLGVSMGLSQLTDVMDRGQVNAMIAQQMAGGGSMPPGMYATPQPGPYQTPQPGVHPSTPPPAHQTPMPGAGGARTFAGSALSTSSAPVPPKRSNVGLLAAIGGLLVVGGGVAAVVVVMGGGSAPTGTAAQTGAPPSTTGAAATAAPPATTSAPAAESTSAAPADSVPPKPDDSAPSGTASTTGTVSAPAATTSAPVAAETTARPHPTGHAPTATTTTRAPTATTTTVKAPPPPPPPPAHANCDINYYLDANGQKHFKPECFK